MEAKEEQTVTGVKKLSVARFSHDTAKPWFVVIQ